MIKFNIIFEHQLNHMKETTFSFSFRPFEFIKTPIPPALNF